MRRCLGVVLACLLPFAAWAHSSSTSYVTIVASGHDASLQWSIALRDLDTAIGLDANDDGDITWGELRARQTVVDAYALSRLRVSTGGADCVAGSVEHLADLLGDGGYAVLRTTLHCPVAIAGLDVRYDALFEIDPNHRALLSVTVDGVPHSGIASPTEPVAHFDTSGGQFTLVRQFFQGGVEHLLAGADHVLFIVMLLAPLLLRPRPAAESPLPRLPEIVTLLTAFTVAHGLTLTLAVLGLAHVSIAAAELGVAATILVTAVDNIVPFLPRQRGLLAFGFGLIHGLGVAGGLGPLHLPAASLALALLSFSLGLEAAQIGIALAASPVAHVLRATPAVSHRMLPVLSGGVALLAVLWIGEGAQHLAATPAATVLSMQEIRYAA
jgi:HupE / UreJ protein